MLLDSFVPRYDAAEHHEVIVHAPVDVAYRAVKELDLARMPVVAALLVIRGLPHLVTGRLRVSRRLGLKEIVDAGFVVLAEEPGAEIVLGVVGRFWRPTSGIRPIERERFIEFAEPGFAKAAWNFAVTADDPRMCTVVTETRIVGTDDAARRRFRAYWRLVGPFSALIRGQILRQVKRTAERAAQTV